MTRAAVIAALALADCSAPPRSASFFRAHPEEARRMAAACAAGAARGPECDNAVAAEAQTRSDARLTLYKKSF